jgi:hypothetical protein
MFDSRVLFRAASPRKTLVGSISLTILTICLLLWGPNSAHAQALSGINGTVTDASGAVVPNAKVTVTNNATSVSRVATTSSAGTYDVTDLIPGVYTVRVESPGFQAAVINNAGIEVAKSSTVNAMLQPGNAEQTIEVTGSLIALETTQPSLGTSIENKVVQELPNELPGGRGRQIDQFVFLAPGVTGGTFSKRINGGVDFQNEVVFNGIPMAQAETQGFQTIWNPPFELVNEFNVLRSSFSAQYGLAQGAITYQTASGTNAFHGDGFEILRNNYFDARGAYNPTTPIDKENNFGFTIAGPVWIPKLYNGRNRTFFHLSMEWYRQNQSQTGTFSAPTAAEVAGDFSALPNPIFDPAAGQPGSCTANGNVPGTKFIGNVIPKACFSATSSSLLQYVPTATLPGFANNTSNQIGVLPTRQNPWGFTIDHNITDRQSIHFVGWRDKQTSYGGSSIASTNPLAFFTYFPDLGTVAVANYSYSINPSLVMTAGASWLGELNFQIPSRNGPQPTLAAAPGAPIVPGINFNGPLSPINFGSSNTNSINRKLGWVIDNNWMWVHGKHTFNIGLELRRTYQEDNECQQCAGNFNFSNNQTADPHNLSNTGNAFASFLLGTVDSSDRIGSQELRLRNRAISTYIQDDIKIMPRMTVNIGVRWDIMVPFTEVNNTIVYFDSKIPNPDAGGLLGAATKFGNCTGCSGFNRADVVWTHLSPRAGVSYQLNNKTVLQAGGAMNYLDGGAYEYGTSKVAVNYGNLLLGAFQRNSTGSPTPGFGSWDTNVQPTPGPTPFRPGIGNAVSIDAFNRADGIAPYTIAWNAGIQRELPYQMFVNAAYVGDRSNYLPSQLNPINQIQPKYLAQYGSLLGQAVNSPAAIAAGVPIPYPNFLSDFGSSATVLQALRPYPQYASIFNNFDNTGSALYNALQVQVTKRYSSGLSFLVSYTLSRMMSNTNSGFTSFVGSSLNKDNQKSEWSIDNNDQTHVASIAATYELPIGPGKPFLNTHNLAGKLLGGWQLSPLLQYGSGGPIQVYVAGNPLGAGGNRPNIVPGVPLQFSYNNVYKGLPVLNAAAFTDPGPWAIGNEPRYVSGMRNPAGLNENVALAKSFPLGEHVKAKLEMEYFNLLNRLIFCGPNNNLNDPNFGKVIRCQGNTQRQGQAHFTVTF